MQPLSSHAASVDATSQLTTCNVIWEPLSFLAFSQDPVHWFPPPVGSPNLWGPPACGVPCLWKPLLRQRPQDAASLLFPLLAQAMAAEGETGLA